jgi:hypothetical protein
MTNPFVYEEAVQPEDLIDREEQVTQLVNRLIEVRNTRLAAPRRYGKTSLLRKVLRDATDNDLVPVYVNFLGVLTGADVAERIELAYRAQLDSTLKRWFEGLVRTLHPSVGVSAPGVPFQAGVAPTVTNRVLLERLAVPRELYAKHGRACAIVFDEFQDVMAAGSSVDAVIRSELEQHGPAAGYVFSGSKPGMMRELFSDSRRAFYTQAGQVNLPPLDSQDLAQHIGQRFQDHGRDVGTALGPLLDTVNGHPQRAMLLAYHLFQATPPRTTADSDNWSQALSSACLEIDGEVQEAWRSLTATQQRLAAVVAEGGLRVGSATAQSRFGLTRSGKHAETLKVMGDEAILVEEASTATGWRITDPLFALWLRSGRRWPSP